MAHSVSRTLFIAGAITGTLIGVTACSSGPRMVSKDDIAKQITSKMTDAAARQPEAADDYAGLFNAAAEQPTAQTP